jgi:murein DD-endopeptidase MepM/ murein hydrolase activator NlpD
MSGDVAAMADGAGAGGWALAIARLREQVAAVTGCLSELLFLPGAGAGFLLCVVLACVPGLLLGGLAGWAGAAVVAWLCAGPQGIGGSARGLQGAMALNPLLAGLCVGHLVAPGLALVAVAVGAGAATMMVAVVLRAVGEGARGVNLPLLSLPFSLVATALWLAMPHWSGLPVAAPVEVQASFAETSVLPAWLHGLLAGLGALVFMPLPWVGAALALLLLWHSRVLAVLAFGGWAVAALVQGALHGDAATAWGRADGFNAMLAAMAIGGVFLVPSWRSSVLALFAAGLCVLLGDVLQGWWSGLWGAVAEHVGGMEAMPPPFTLPFCAVVVGLLAVLQRSGSALLAAKPGMRPEDAIAEHWAWRARFPGNLRSLAPPFAGAWTVWQGEDGRWTHRGAWRHALDFVVVDDDGQTCVGEGGRVEDYHAFNRPVLSPVAGMVVTVVDGLPDCAPGHPDQGNRWGNLVVIHDARGFWVELSHFACRSIAVAPGQWVERGQVLGRCGNSGYSPQPHIHLQVQAAPAVGAVTLPFSLASWWGEGRFHANHLPADGMTVEAVPADAGLETSARLLLGQELVFALSRGGRAAGELRATVGLGEDGGTVLRTRRGCLHVGRHEGTFYAYRVEGDDPWLRLMLLALPRLPLCWRPGAVWEDAVAVTAGGCGWRGMLLALGGLALPRLAVLRTRHRFVTRERIEGEILAAPLIPARRCQALLGEDGWIREAVCGAMRMERRVAAPRVAGPTPVGPLAVVDVAA